MRVVMNTTTRLILTLSVCFACFGRLAAEDQQCPSSWERIVQTDSAAKPFQILDRHVDASGAATLFSDL